MTKKTKNFITTHNRSIAHHQIASNWIDKVSPKRLQKLVCIVWYRCFPNIILSQYHKLSEKHGSLSLPPRRLFCLNLICRGYEKQHCVLIDMPLINFYEQEEHHGNRDWNKRQMYRDANDNNPTIRKTFSSHILFWFVFVVVCPLPHSFSLFVCLFVVPFCAVIEC